LTREAEASASFRARCAEAGARVTGAVRRTSARPQDDAGVARVLGGEEARALAAEMGRRLSA
ncbi:MAG: beta-glucosidase family protein, partial [Myxococcota bacterium]|nr:beta-glucosidase family protein [Myxococcota bacterium]